MAKILICKSCTDEIATCCGGSTSNEIFNGIVIQDTVTSAEDKLYAPFTVNFSGTIATFVGAKGTRSNVNLSDTTYADLTAFKTAIKNCQCPAAGSGSTSTFTNNGDGSITHNSGATGATNTVVQYAAQKVEITDALLTAQNAGHVADAPLIADVQAVATAQAWTDRVIYYVGTTGTATDPRYAYIVDIAGNVTEVESPVTGDVSTLTDDVANNAFSHAAGGVTTTITYAKDRVEITDALLTAQNAGHVADSPLIADVQAVATAQGWKDRLVYYVGSTGTAGDPLYAYDADHSGNVTEIKDPSDNNDISTLTDDVANNAFTHTANGVAVTVTYAKDRVEITDALLTAQNAGHTADSPLTADVQAVAIAQGWKDRLVYYIGTTGTAAEPRYAYEADHTGNITLVEAPSTATNDVIYDAGNGAWVVASGLGITFAKAAGLGTFTIPDGVRLKFITVTGTSADATYNNGAWTNAFVITGTYGGTPTYNTVEADMIVPALRVISSQTLGFSDALPFTFDTGTRIPRLSGVGGGAVNKGFDNLDAYANWIITGDYVAGA